MSNAIWSHGTQLQRGDGESIESFTTIAEVKDISAMPIELETVDVTNHDSGGWREHIGGILSLGDVSFEINYQPTAPTHSLLINDLLTKAVRNFRIIYPDGTETPFSGLVTSFEPTAPVDGVVTAGVTIKGTGSVGVGGASTGLTALTGTDSEVEALVFTPSFATNTTLYTVSVGSAITFVKFAPVGAGHTIKINGNADWTGTEFALGASGSVTTFTITAQDGTKSPKTYNVVVTRA